MLFAGKLKMICLLMGLLTIGEVGLQSWNGNAPVTADSTEEISIQDSIEADTKEDFICEEYERLEAEEARLREKLQEREVSLTAEDEAGQIEVMDLNEELRSIQLQKIIWKARMEETF